MKSRIGLVATCASALAALATAGGSPAATISGLQLWNTWGCGGCHTLKATGATETVGPNLDQLQPSPGAVAEQVMSGGGGMPSFGAKMSQTEIAVLARFVSESARTGTAPGAVVTPGGATTQQPATTPAQTAAPAQATTDAQGALPAAKASVATLQRKLAQLGYFTGPFTGVYGPLTTAAVKKFQAAAGLAADGVWGPASQAALAKKLAAAKATTPAAPGKLPPPAASVATLQHALAKLGYFNGPFTGVYGPVTTAAVKKFQTAVGLTADGKWGPASQAALDRKLAGASTATAASSTALPPPSASVATLQHALARLGYFNGPFTGVYGPVTTAAVKRFQAANGLVVDGKWGPASQAVLAKRLGSAG